MIIAVTYENGRVFGHFGHTGQFKIYTVENTEITSCAIVPTGGSGHGALAGFLKARGVDILICGGIGAGAQNALKEAEIKFFGGVTGNADSAVEALLKGNLIYDENAHCDHHGNGAEHICGTHGCKPGSNHH